MSGVPHLFDRALHRTRLARAAASGAPADFLLARAADDLADRLAAVLRPFPNALDVGTPGPHAVHVLAADASRSSIVQAAPLPAALADAPIGRIVGDPGLLPVSAAQFDLAVSLLALHAIDDLPGALAQIRRTLRPDGLFLGCIAGGATLTELRQAFAQAESEMEGGVSPRVSPFADVRDMGGLLQRAGFALPVTDVDSFTVRYPHPIALMQDLRAMGATNIVSERRRTPLRRETLMRAMAIYAERFADPDGKIRASFEFIWLSGWAPHASQQQPLRPGSAKARLADALGVPEHGPDSGASDPDGSAGAGQ